MSEPSPEIVRQVHAEGVKDRQVGPKDFIDLVASSPYHPAGIDILEGTHWLKLEDDGRQVGRMPITAAEAAELASRQSA